MLVDHAKELLLMYVAERNPQPDDVARAFERYTKLTPETARNIIDFYRQRVRTAAVDKARRCGAACGPGRRPVSARLLAPAETCSAGWPLHD